jgi:arylsulfatase A-like enzyme
MPSPNPARLGAAFVACTAVLGARAQEARPPNVVFVLADDLGWGELGCFGQQKIATPNLDRLAAQGMRFTRHYAGAPVCAPSRCVLMTGLHPGHAPIRDNREATPGEGQAPLPAAATILPEVLQAGGFVTGAFGKWGLGMFGSEGDPLAQGWHRFYGYNCQRHAHSHWPGFLWDGSRRLALGNEPAVPGAGKLADGVDPADPDSYARFVGTDYAPDRIHAEALAFVRAHAARPFLCFLPSTLPHLALQAPADALAPYAGAFPETPYAGGKGYTPHRTPRAAYAAMITRLDRHVGELMALLDELELAQHTILVFTSDNGATHSPVGGTDVDFFDSCGGLRGRKGSLYEGGIRVPAIVRWPGVVRPGSQSDRVTGFEDWLPTLADACGAVLPAGLDGQSLLPLLRGAAQPARPFLYREFAGYGGWQALWQGSRKIVRQKLQAQDSPFELYDLAQDPREERDLAAANRGEVAALAKLAAAQHAPSAAFPLAAIDGKPPAARGDGK